MTPMALFLLFLLYLDHLHSHIQKEVLTSRLSTNLVKQRILVNIALEEKMD